MGESQLANDCNKDWQLAGKFHDAKLNRKHALSPAKVIWQLSDIAK
jgi:hypothetical protein